MPVPVPAPPAPRAADPAPPSPAPEQAPDLILEPFFGPSPDPVPEPGPEPVHDPVPEPIPGPVPEPSQGPDPGPPDEPGAHKLIPSQPTPINTEDPVTTSEKFRRLKELPIIKGLMETMPGSFVAYEHIAPQPQAAQAKAAGPRRSPAEGAAAMAEDPGEADFFEAAPDGDDGDD
ncbi:MAG: hypothetical protein LBF58_03245 [Deltaproteobacteria bacterium]|nr:hypothetical protein [Deltaproteobacteria bacterium]